LLLPLPFCIFLPDAAMHQIQTAASISFFNKINEATNSSSACTLSGWHNNPTLAVYHCRSHLPSPPAPNPNGGTFQLEILSWENKFTISIASRGVQACHKQIARKPAYLSKSISHDRLMRTASPP